MTDPEPRVELDGVRYYYRDGSHRQLVLDGVTASLAQAESIALLGASGSGKSTLLNLIAGIELPASGHVRISGVELNSLSERERTLFRRRHIGFVYQFFNLIPHLTLLENIRLPSELNGERPHKAADYGLEWLQRMGLRDRAGAFPEQVSGGE
ncbi:ABC transporter ATP-binding protein [Acidihalobacter prosperus]